MLCLYQVKFTPQVALTHINLFARYFKETRSTNLHPLGSKLSNINFHTDEVVIPG